MTHSGLFIATANPCCKECWRDCCEYNNTRGMCLNRGRCEKMVTHENRKDVDDGE